MGLIEAGIRGIQNGRAEIAALLLALVAVAAAATTSGPEAVAPDDEPMQATRAQLEAVAGPADRCLHSAPGREVCRFSVAGRLVRPDETRLRSGVMHLICDLPKHGGGSGVCRPESRVARAADTLPPVSAEPPGGPDAPTAAPGWLRDATDVASLSRRLGDVPEACRARFDLQECRWSVPTGTAAHAQLAPLAQTSGDVQLDCLLPLDGSPRAADACRVIALGR